MNRATLIITLLLLITASYIGISFFNSNMKSKRLNLSTQQIQNPSSPIAEEGGAEYEHSNSGNRSNFIDVKDVRNELQSIISEARSLTEVMALTEHNNSKSSDDIKRTAGSMLYTCSVLIGDLSKEVAIESTKRWAKEKIDHFCGTPELIESYSSSDLYKIGSNLYNNTIKTLESIQEDRIPSDQSTYNLMSERMDYVSLSIIAGWMTEQHYLNPDAEIIPDLNVNEIPLDLALEATGSAVEIYYCSFYGGCDRENFRTLLYCYYNGCEPFINTLEQAIYRSRSPRHIDVMNTLLRAYRSLS